MDGEIQTGWRIKQESFVDPTHYRGMIGTLLISVLPLGPDQQFAICHGSPNGVISLLFCQNGKSTWLTSSLKLLAENNDFLINKLENADYIPGYSATIGIKVDE
ncbi:hypothetical protein Tco_1017667 [Tanacetum coccineum]|uniref:Uncharacterized protein n=1 Tax=Tanacetum coccineum TaxID=301880 RepID=A0ABQ5FUQ2_9ASTR